MVGGSTKIETTSADIFSCNCWAPCQSMSKSMTVSQYLASLVSNAVTVINAEDYGRAIYDLALRRALITIGEDVVNIAYDAPLDMRWRKLPTRILPWAPLLRQRPTFWACCRKRWRSTKPSHRQSMR